MTRSSRSRNASPRTTTPALLRKSRLLRPARDLTSMRERLAELGQARLFDGELVLDETPQRVEMQRVVDRIRNLMGVRD